MNNLPISSTPQPSGNAANALQTNIAADGLALDAQPGDPFAFLLARQIGGVEPSVPDTAQTTGVIDDQVTNGGTDPAMKDAQDPSAGATAPTDLANMLAAIMLQLSAPENKGQKMEEGQSTQPFASSHLQKTEGAQATQPLALDPFRKAGEDSQAVQPLALSPSQEAEHKIPMAGPENSQMNHTIGSLPSEAATRAEPPSGPAHSTPAQVMPTPAAMPVTPTHSMPADTTPAIAAPLGHKGWADEFSQKISWIATQQNQVAELHLNPPNLGPLDVVLKISDNQATALFASPHGAVRDAVENALPKLREILADNGIMLGNTTISDHPPRDRSMDGFMNQGFGTAAQHGISAPAPEPAGALPAAAQTVPVRRHNGMVDTFA